jgi:hypothetical protein
MAEIPEKLDIEISLNDEGLAVMREEVERLRADAIKLRKAGENAAKTLKDIEKSYGAEIADNKLEDVEMSIMLLEEALYGKDHGRGDRACATCTHFHQTRCRLGGLPTTPDRWCVDHALKEVAP